MIDDCDYPMSGLSTSPALPPGELWLKLSKRISSFAVPKGFLRREESRANLVPRYATIARDLNVAKRTCKGTELCMALLARKKWSRFHKERWRSALKSSKAAYIFKHIVLGAESFNSSEPVAARGEIGREGFEISSLVEHMGLSPWLFL